MGLIKMGGASCGTCKYRNSPGACRMCGHDDLYEEGEPINTEEEAEAERKRWRETFAK